MTEEKKNSVPVVLPIRDIDVARDAKDSSGAPALLRVFRDHEPGVPPMYFIDFVTVADERAKRALIPIIDVDATRVAEAVMRVQTEYAEVVRKWHQGEEGAAPRGARIPPREIPIEIDPMVISRRK